MAQPPNLLEASGLPLVYPIAAGDELIPQLPDADGFDVVGRTVVRSLTVMQKEAVVATSGSPIAWRLSSDEGPYLNGHDFAPAPLAVMTCGFAADLMEQISKSVAAADLPSDGLTVTLDTHFTMEGSFLAGTMVGGANPPEITLSTLATDRSQAMAAVLTGINASAMIGLVGPSLTGLFSLTSHGKRIPVGEVAEVNGEVPPDPGGRTEPPKPDPDLDPGRLVTKIAEVEERPPDAGVGLQESQKRSLHLKATGSWREDGVKQIDVQVIRPTGSTFRFLSAEPEGGAARAPDALSLMSAGLGFCFMTQIGRWAKIRKNSLGDYHIIQDTRFSLGDATVEPPVGGRAAPPQTHVYLSPDGGDDFARDALDMAEQTCFLHALCRTELRPKVRVVGARGD